MKININNGSNPTIKKNNLFELARFIVKENHTHHVSLTYREEEFLHEILLVYEEDIALFDNSTFYVACNHSGIIGSVKVTRWDEKSPLPIEKLFNLKIKSMPALHGDFNIWHVGRFAVSRENGIILLKQLLIKAISTICKDPKSIMVAECDKKFVRALNMMGIRTETLASSVHYLGSETVPIYATNEWLQEFLDQMVVT